ncbi:hypothetical protein PSEUDO9AG_30161 [Pseudomonas sp. 9Ag]|nr:hypothetical protein PSEUDO9AG_30161 [Pseudomonas sp. 9Ag]
MWSVFQSRNVRFDHKNYQDLNNAAMACGLTRLYAIECYTTRYYATLCDSARHYANVRDFELNVLNCIFHRIVSR